jgi:hypothetical protein
MGTVFGLGENPIPDCCKTMIEQVMVRTNPSDRLKGLELINTHLDSHAQLGHDTRRCRDLVGDLIIDAKLSPLW